MQRTRLCYDLAALAVGAIFLGCRRDRLGGGGQTAPMPENPSMDPLYIGLGTPL